MQCFFLVFYWKCRYSCASICCVIEFLIISFLLALEFFEKNLSGKFGLFGKIT